MNQRPPARRVPVKVDVAGTPKTGYKILREAALPDFVEVRGDASAIGKIESISTRPVDVSGRESSYSTSVALVIPSGVSEIEVNRVTASVEIAADIVTKTFPNVVIQLKDPPIGFTWDMNPIQVTVELEGRSDIMAQVKASDVQAYIDASDITAADVGLEKSFSPRIVTLGDLPAGIKIKNISDRVVLTLTKR
jgi:YbbR domain-containing protein